MDTTCLSFYIVKLIPLAFISQQEKHLYSLEITKLLFTERTWCSPIGLDRVFFELIMCSIVQRTMPLVETPFCVSLKQLLSFSSLMETSQKKAEPAATAIQIERNRFRKHILPLLSSLIPNSVPSRETIINFELRMHD